ncbi:hypothetical protein [Allochromatium palmeri]|uniref:Uncharacterized protein n=1 Tax=Allochromatium palmeri TaxID=231048 RepID=A0A6N8ECY7_9GAMM|nr:hypothetical protein [Allochromatium palmeri]
MSTDDNRESSSNALVPRSGTGLAETGRRTHPVLALKDWNEKRPELFKKRVYNLRGLDRKPRNDDSNIPSRIQPLCLH